MLTVRFVRDQVAKSASGETFLILDQLFDHTDRTPLVLAQAFSHILHLATLGACRVKQDRPYGDIVLYDILE